MRRGKYKEEDEVEQLLQAAQDEMILKLSVNSHTSRSSSDYLDPDLHSRFLALRSQPSTKKKDQQHRQKRRPRSPPPKSKDVVEETPEDLMLRFAALKTSLPSSSSVLLPNEIGEEDSDEIGEDAEVEKLIQWAIDSRVYTDFSESSSLNSTFLNLNFTSLKPILIVKPKSESEIKSSILCSRKLGVQVRTMSGGHDYEGLSYLSQSPFIIIDLVNLRSININLTDETAWIQSGATLGELYYKIAKTSKIHAFAAGICPSVGVGGHISGGGFGTIMRKHGLASDNVVDARLMDVNGRILDRKTMGEDLFWALRGGGAASFGVVLSWKVKLARVPEKVTCFISQHPMGSSMNKLVHRWQSIGSELDEDLFIRVIIDNSLEGNQRKVKTTFQTLFLGGIDRLIPLMNQKFPELGLRAQECSEMSWIESIMFFNWRSGQPLEILLNRDLRFEDQYFKAKSDYVQKPVPENVFGEVTKRFLEQDTPLMILEPLGGKISQVSETESPYPHRKGNLYNIQYMVKWKVNEVEEMNKHVRWMRSLYDYMSPYVSKSPRGAYLNYRDLDLGTNKGINTSFEDARKWGERYYKGNFKRLCLVKGKIDPTNFFRNEQSIPPLF